MKTRYNINISELEHYTTQINNIIFNNCENLENVAESDTFKTLDLSINGDGRFTLVITLLDNTQRTYTEVDYDEIISYGNFSFDADVIDTNVNKILQLIQLQVIAVNLNNQTTILTFLQNDPNDHVTKTLTGVKVFDGSFRTPINIKSFEIDVADFNAYQRGGYNYIYLPILKRFYYVRAVTQISNDLTRLYLSEDVLMSWASLIRQQTAFVTRASKTLYYDKDIEDLEIKTDYNKSISVTTITPTTNIFQESTTPYVLTLVRK